MMSVGAVIYATGKEKLTELGNLAKPLFWALVFCLIGALSIAGAPYLNGYISKSIIVSAAAYEQRSVVELMLNIAAMGTFLSIGLKLVWNTFFGDKKKQPKIIRSIPISMYIAMTLSAAICIITGIFPTPLYDLLPNPDIRYQPFTANHFVQAMQLLLSTALGFWMLRKMLAPTNTITLDVDSIYRKPLFSVLENCSQFLVTTGKATTAYCLRYIDKSWNMLFGFNIKAASSTVSFHAMLVLVVFGAVGFIALFYLGLQSS
jgi:multicomponent Na+:H+ antiporter subunit D